MPRSDIHRVLLLLMANAKERQTWAVAGGTSRSGMERAGGPVDRPGHPRNALL